MNKMMLKKQYMMYSPKKSRLPSAYQEVEYIESTGTQLIDTNIKVSDLSSDISMSYKFMPLNELTTSDSYYLGTYGAYPNYFMQLSTRSSVSNVYFYCGNPEKSGEAYFTRSNWTNYKQTLIVNINGTSGDVSLNGTQKTFSYSVPTISGSLYIGALNNNGVASINNKTRIYEFKFKNNGTLIRNFIPCYRKSDNEIGMYDLVGNQFYTNAGSGTFLMGRPLVYDTIQGYQQVDYIESTGTQYIDTNYVPTIDDVIETDIEFNSITIKPADSWLTVFGAYPTKSLWLYKEMNGVPVYFCTYSGGSNVYKIMQVSTNIPYNIIFKKDTFIVNGISYSINNETRTSQDTLSLFRVNPYSASSYPLFTGKLRTFKVYKDNKYSINFIPMRRLSDNELGLYDLVNGVFYTNQGSGEFIAGEVLKA